MRLSNFRILLANMLICAGFISEDLVAKFSCVFIAVLWLWLANKVIWSEIEA